MISILQSILDFFNQIIDFFSEFLKSMFSFFKMLGSSLYFITHPLSAIPAFFWFFCILFLVIFIVNRLLNGNNAN